MMMMMMMTMMMKMMTYVVRNTATLLTAVNAPFLPFSRHKLRMIALLVFLQIEMTDFPTLSYTATNKIPTLSYI